MCSNSFQEGEHSSIQDAQATMRLYTMHKKEWEAEINQKKLKNAEFNQRKSKKSTKSKNINASVIQNRSQQYVDSDSE